MSLHQYSRAIHVYAWYTLYLLKQFSSPQLLPFLFVKLTTVTALLFVSSPQLLAFCLLSSPQLLAFCLFSSPQLLAFSLFSSPQLLPFFLSHNSYSPLVFTDTHFVSYFFMSPVHLIYIRGHILCSVIMKSS